MKKLSLSMIIMAFIVSACTPGVYNTNSTHKGRKIFVAECSPGGTSVCRKRATSKCGGGYTKISQKTITKTYKDPVYRTRYVHNYRYVQGANGRLHRVPYNNRYRYVSHYRHVSKNITQMRFSCRKG